MRSNDFWGEGGTRARLASVAALDRRRVCSLTHPREPERAGWLRSRCSGLKHIAREWPQMLHTVSLGLVSVAFLGAGLFNVIGTPATRSSFVRWGYPAWWCRLTGGLEIATAILTASSNTREAGLIL